MIFINVYNEIQVFSLQKYEPVSKSQLKKVQKIWVRECYKEADKKNELDEAEQNRVKNLEEAKQIKILEDQSLPKAKRIKIDVAPNNVETRVKIYGWVHRLRRQGTYSSLYLILN